MTPANIKENERKHIIENPVLRTSFAAWAGGLFAGTIGVMVGHPFDTMKVRVQVGKAAIKKGGSFYYRLSDLYRGVIPPSITAGVIMSLNFFMYENIKRYFTHPDYYYYTESAMGIPISIDAISSSGMVKLPPSYHHKSTGENTSPFAATASDMDIKLKMAVDLKAVVMGACLSGITSSIVNCPVSIVKVQQQVVSELGTLATAKFVYRKYNTTKIFYRGFGPTFLSEVYGRGIYFFVYEKSKIEIAKYLGRHEKELSPQQQKNYVDPKSNILGVRMASAALAGCTSWLFAYPLDVIKNKLQVDVSGDIYQNSIQCAKHTYKEGGIRAFFRGLSFTLIRAAPVAALILPIYEYSMENVERML